MHGLVAQQQAYLPSNSDESYFLSLLSSPTFYIPSPVEIVAEQQEQADPQHDNELLAAVAQQQQEQQYNYDSISQHQHQQVPLDNSISPPTSVSSLPPFLQPLQEESKSSNIVTKSPRTKKKAPLPYASNLLNLCFNTSSSSLQTSSKPVKKRQSTTQRKHRSTASKNNIIHNSSNKSDNNNKDNNKNNMSSNNNQHQHPKYQCDFDGCNKVFTRPYNLKSHKRTHTAEKPFICPHCPKRFARQHDRNRHAKLHTGIKAYTCHHCNKAFARQDALSRHQRPSGHGLCCSNSSNNNNNNNSSPLLMTNVNHFATTTILSSSL
ncbi:hypothetical protein INT45_002359 [Circinella minor]|uniref:C2H2-type domain-containing protein n=1 Tax=Circinella minor TaxID=1195481 RepID=A0A8H7VKN5_9FUNG|nr:hypothetical protein INT45_002359 [Circinella minor]